MENNWEFDCPQYVDFTSGVSDYGPDDNTWFEVDHEKLETVFSVKSPAIKLDPAPTIDTMPQSTVTNDAPKDPVIEENNDANKEVILSDSSNRSPLNNRSNVLLKEEFYRNKKNRLFGIKEASVSGKENAINKKPSRVLRPGANSSAKNNERSDELSKEPKPVFAKPLPEQNKHRRSLSAGHLNFNKAKEEPASASHNTIKKSTSKNLKGAEKLYQRRSVSTERINSQLSASSESLPNRHRSASTSSVNSVASDSSGTSTLSKNSGVPRKYNLVPSAHSRIPQKNNKMSSSELEMQKIEQIRQQALMIKKLSEKSLKMSLHSKGHVPQNSNLKPTVPKEFEFKSNQRLRSHSADHAKSPATNWAQILRKNDHSTLNNKPQPRMTRVQPFKLSENKKMETHIEKFKTVAEQVMNFTNKTPQRFRKHSKENKSQVSSKPLQCTIPITPTFARERKTRPITFLSTKEIEEKELEEIQSYKFKAKEVDKKIFQTRTGIKEVAKKERTVPVPFNLSVAPVKKEVEEEQYTFHAKPLPREILERVVGVKPVETREVTIPESPAFALKQRMQRPVTSQVKKEIPIPKIKPKPYVHPGVKFEPQIEHKCTIVEPFTFDEKIKENEIKKQQRIQKVLEESSIPVTEFSAQPIPDYSMTGLPPKKPPTLTKPVPFKHHIEERVEKRLEDKQQQLQEEMRLQQEKMQFKAQPCDVVRKAPFIPQLDHKCTKEDNKFKLYTEARHTQRIQFEEYKKAREAELLAVRLEAERLRQEEEEREIQKWRKEAVHKANPIKHYKPVEKLHSAILTIPMTPELATKNRVRYDDKE